MQGCRHTQTYALYRRERREELAPDRKSRGFTRDDDYAYRCLTCGALVPDVDTPLFDGT